MTEHAIVWDLETIPDLAAGARMLDMVAAPEAEVRAALARVKRVFQRHIQESAALIHFRREATDPAAQ